MASGLGSWGSGVMDLDALGFKLPGSQVYMA